jgi:pimeloyl-ACP methyl ester carboxylesterase
VTAPDEATAHDLLLRGVRIHYAEAGEGPTVLLVHGFMMDHRVWRNVVPLLAKRFRVILPDLPGFGASEKPSRYAYTLTAFADTLCDLLAGLDLPRAHVVGHALGGAVALTFAAEHPEYVDRMAVLDTLAYPFERPLRARWLQVPVLGAFLFRQMYNRVLFRRHFRDEVLAPDVMIDRAAIDQWYDAFTPPEAREAAWKTLRNTLDLAPLGPRLARVRAPAAVIWGEHDRMLPPYLGRRLARDLGDCRLDVIPGAGHAPAVDHPEVVSELLTTHFTHGAGTRGTLPSILPS